MNTQNKNPFDLIVDQFRAVVREEIAKALAEKRPAKLLFNTKEAAAMLDVHETWLATKARANEVPYRRLGTYRYFSMADIEAIIEKAASNNGGG